MTAEDQRIFLDHMGHEANINRDNYQCPLGLKEVQVMGKVLNSIDTSGYYFRLSLKHCHYHKILL